MTNKALTARAVVWVDVGDGKFRRAVLLEVVGEQAWLAPVTRTSARETICVHVPHPSPTATALGLSEPTFFYASNIAQHLLAGLKHTGKQCPLALHGELVQMLRSHARTLLRPGATDVHAEHVLLPSGERLAAERRRPQ